MISRIKLWNYLFYGLHLLPKCYFSTQNSKKKKKGKQKMLNHGS